MLTGLTFSGPSGPFENPDFGATDLRERIFSRGEDYWNGDSGSAGISYQDDEKKSVLSFTFKDGHGYFINHGEFVGTRGEVWRAASSNEDFEEGVELQFGGNEEMVPVALFVSRDEAWKIIEEFCNTAGRAPGVRWVDRDDPRWEEFRDRWEEY